MVNMTQASTQSPINTLLRMYGTADREAPPGRLAVNWDTPYGVPEAMEAYKRVATQHVSDSYIDLSVAEEMLCFRVRADAAGMGDSEWV